MDHLAGKIYDRRKDQIVLGTFESSAFILSLRNEDEFSSIHSFGYHSIPHIGVYGHDYTPSLPMVLLSLPPVPSCLERLPSDLLNALDIDLGHFETPTKTGVLAGTSTTKLQLFSEHLQTILKDHSDANPDVSSRIVAKELVNFVLVSACNKLGLNGTSYSVYPNGFKQSENKHINEMLNIEDVSFAKYRERKRDSTCSAMSIDRDSNMSPQIENYDCTETSFMSLQPESGYFSCGDRGCSGRKVPPEDMEDSEEKGDLRTTAKKLVKKALHLACKRWERMYRRCSIEYLIADAKRMRITNSPSPPPTLLEETTELSTSVESQELLPRRERSPILPPLRKRGTKRGRSESHNTYMMKELEKFRQTQLEMTRKANVTSPQPFARVKNISDCTISQSSDSMLSLLEPPPTNMRGLNVLISDMGRMSIAEAQSESGSESEAGEEYIVLNAITKKLPSEDGNKQEDCPDGCVFSRRVLTPTAAAGGSLVQMKSPVSDQWLYQEQKSLEIPAFEGYRNTTTERQTNADIHVNPGPGRNSHPIPNMDLYIVIHTHPVPSLCQKFLCSNMNEINLMYHCWLFQSIPYDESITASEMLEMGLFEPCGVLPVHLDLADAGIAFHYLDKRTVCIHHCHFSPENAQLQLVRGVQLHSFFSAAKHGERRVVTYHIIPATERVEQTLRQCLVKCTTMRELLSEISYSFPDVGQKILDLISPLSD